MSFNKITRTVLLSLLAVTIVAALLGLIVWKRTPVVHASNPVCPGQPCTTDYGNITNYLTGYNLNVVMVSTNAPFADLGCGGSTQQYSTLDGVEGNPAFHAALLGALLSNKKVAIIVQGCAYTHPQIIGVAIQP